MRCRDDSRSSYDPSSDFVWMQTSGLVHTEPKNPFFVNHCLKITNGIKAIDSEKTFIVVVANFSNVPRKLPKHNVLGYATRSTTLLTQVDSPLVSHISKSLRYAARSEPNAVEESPRKPYHKKPWIPGRSCSTRTSHP